MRLQRKDFLIKGRLFIPSLLIGIALLAFIGYFIIYNMYAFSLFQFPFDYDQGEGFELADTVLFSQGQWPYRDNNSYPFYSSNYPPVFHLVTIPLVWFFGPQYWTGRLVSYLGTLITAAAIGYAVHREGKKWWLSTLAGLAFLASNYIYHVGPLFRQHMFMVMFETLAIVTITIIIQKEEKTGNKNNRGILLVMVFLLLAGYTKQLAYATVAATFIFFFLRQYKRAIKWALAFAVTTLLIFVLINVATDGQWLINTITANINPFIPGQAFGLFRQWFQLHTVLILAAAAFAIYQLYFERLSAYSIWFVIAVANSVTAGKWGAGESYFATAIAAACILTGLVFARIIDFSEIKGKNWKALSIVAITILFLVQANKVFHMPTNSASLKTIATILGKPNESYVEPQTSCSNDLPAVPVPYVDSAGVSLLGRLPTAIDKGAGEAISAYVAAGTTPAFSEEAGFNFYVGRDIVTNPTQLLNLYNNNQVDLTEMLSMLDNQEFDSVIFRAKFYPPPVLDVIDDKYETVDLIEMNGFVYCILEPK